MIMETSFDASSDIRIIGRMVQSLHSCKRTSLKTHALGSPKVTLLRVEKVF
jgi:hypothetical protein